MACFLVPMGAAIAGTIVRKKISEKLHFDWLLLMLWGGVVMLVIDHLINREVVPYPPFLTKGFGEVLPEMLKVGIPMTLAVVGVWIVMVVVSQFLARKTESSANIPG